MRRGKTLVASAEGRRPLMLGGSAGFRGETLVGGAASLTAAGVVDSDADAAALMDGMGVGVRSVSITLVGGVRALELEVDGVEEEP